MKLLLTLLLFMVTDQPRQVLLFYNDDHSEEWKKQVAELNTDLAGIKERDIVVKYFKLSPQNTAVWKKWNVNQSEDFTFILIGRDGGEKYRSDEFVSNKELFGKIDAMPMRRSEVKK